MSHNDLDKPTLVVPPTHHVPDDRAVPTLYGFPLKYVSLVTLAVQNAALTLIMHTSRITTPPSRQYSAASAVLLNELLKGSISLAIAFTRVEVPPAQTPRRAPQPTPSAFAQYSTRARRVARDILSPDCWKLSVPAILYVVQNNLQYVAASNLDAATFQVTYQMKILTTAAFSVLLLRRQLTRIKWIALFLLALGVGVVQIQSGNGAAPKPGATADEHAMDPMRGFLAVTAACFTSGLAGVYFEMVLKNSQADLWVRNVQLSLFSLPPALLPALLDATNSSASIEYPGLLPALFRNFGPWAWATVLTQVLGGLLTALVIKHADNILKGFATALSIILAAIASVILFGFRLSPAFLGGATVVLGATWMYNWPQEDPEAPRTRTRIALGRASKPSSALGSPIGSASPILGEPEKKRAVSARAIAAALGLARDDDPLENEPIAHPLYTPPPSRPPSPLPPPPSRPSSRLSVPAPSLSRSGSSGSLR